MTYRREPGYTMTCFHGLALADEFNQVMNIAKEQNRAPSLSQLFAKESKGNTVIDILGARKKLGVLEDAQLWYRNQQAYFNMVSRTPHVYRDQFNPNEMQRKFARIKMNKAKKPPANIRRRPKP